MVTRVLYLIDSLGMGGAERGLVLNLLHLDRARFDPEVAILGRDMTLAPELESAGIPIHQLRAGKGPRALGRLGAVRRLLKSGGFDIVHSSLVWASILGNLAGRAARVTVVEHLVNVDPQGRQAATLSTSVRRKTRFVAATDAWIGRFCVDRYVSISRATTVHAPWAWMRDPRRVRIVARGQDLEDLADRAALEPDPPLEPSSGPTLVTVGRLYPQKGHRDLIDAMPHVVSEHPDVRLLILGDGPLRRELKDRVRALDLTDHIRFLGVRRDAPAVVARADVFVFPSLWEGQGNAVVEAAALGRPIVTTRIAAMEETFVDGESALLVSPSDPGKLAEAINAVLADPTSAATLGDAAREVASERFDIRATTRGLERVYDELVAGG